VSIHDLVIAERVFEIILHVHELFEIFLGSAGPLQHEYLCH
jgi:hypothetical protein